MTTNEFGPGGMPQSTSRFEGLDGLRGFAALIVVAGHLTADFIAVTGVYLFFVLSAFLLTSQFLNWQAKQFSDPRHWIYYLQRRFLRIYPMFAIVAIISCVTTTMQLAWLDGEGLPLTVRSTELIKVMAFQAGPNVLWTIPVEFRFYLILPVIAFMLVVVCRNRLSASLALLLIATAAAMMQIAPAKHSLQLWPFLSLFLSGCIAAVLNRRLEERSTFRNTGSVAAQHTFLKWTMEVIAWLALASWAFTMPLLQRVILGAPIDRQTMVLMHPLYAVIFTALIICMLNGTGYLRNLLEFRAAKWVGAISFSLYLWHIGPIRLFDAIPGLHPHIGGVMAVLVSLFISSVTYWYIERPILRGTRLWLKPNQLATQ